MFHELVHLVTGLGDVEAANNLQKDRQVSKAEQALASIELDKVLRKCIR